MSKITLLGKIGHFNSQSMSLKIIANGQTLYCFDQSAEKNFTVSFDLTLPGTIEFVVNNKNPFDTRIDSQGNIVEDKFIRIDHMVIDRMPLKSYLLQNQIINFFPKDQTKNSAKTNCFSYNGHAIIDIPYTNSFEFLLNSYKKPT